MNKPEIIITSCIYNRTNTLDEYMKSLKETTTKDYLLILVNNCDELAEQTDAYISHIARRNGIENFQVITLPNTGLAGFNIGLELGKIYDVPVMLCNDDIIFGKNWCECLMREDITECPLSPEMKIHKIRPESVGIIAPVYKNAGCMKHQEYSNHKHGYMHCDFCVGHSQLITRNALRKGFTFDQNVCTMFGPYDVAQAQIMLSLELNILICYDTCFTFPKDEESHFQNGDLDKFNPKYVPIGEKMAQNLLEFNKKHVAKYGYNKWWFE